MGLLLVLDQARPDSRHGDAGGLCRVSLHPQEEVWQTLFVRHIGKQIDVK